MICSPNSNLRPPFYPTPSIPGLGLPFSMPKIPFPDVTIPDGIPEDLIDLLNQLFALIPGGKLGPNPDNFMKDVWDAIASILNQLAPYLALYNFFQALLNLIMCIIDVICSLMNPFKLRRAVKRLFQQCLPPFLNLFPWLALLAMILALILLLLALLEYLYNLIRRMIEEIIRNLEILAQGVSFQDTQSTIDAALKISYLLCYIEFLFSILMAFQAIFAIIASLADISGRSVCARGSVGGDTCCSEEVCPDFIRNNPNGEITGTLGVLYYLKQRTDPLDIVTVRSPSWQFYDAENNRTYIFSDIITPVDDIIFWPQPNVYPATTSVRKAPYLVDMSMFVDPNAFDIPADAGGARTFVIKDIIVEMEPYLGLVIYDGTLNESINQTGTFRLVGGKVYESDGVTPYLINGKQGTLQTFVYLNSAPGPIVGDDGYFISNIAYTWRTNIEALIGTQTINVMCAPEISAETTIINNTTDFDSVYDKLGSVGVTSLPDIAGTIECLTNSLNELKADVSIDNCNTFLGNMESCINNLRGQCEDTYTGGVRVGTNIYETDVSLTPDVQFISQPIIVSVQLNDANGVNIITSVPANSQQDIADLLDGDVTFGHLGDFAYNSSDGTYTAELTSSAPGSGTIRVRFDNQVISEFLNRDDEEENTVVSPVILTYQFVGVPVSAVGTEEEKPRRGPEDVAGA